MSATPLDRRIIRVDRPDDPRLEDYRDLREADLAARREAFIAESRVVLEVLVTRGRFTIRSVFAAEGRLAAIAPLLKRLDPAIPVYVGTQALLSGVVGFRIHRGILAAGRREPVPEPARLLASLGAGPRTVVALEGVTNHDNVGGVLRNAAAFGADALLYDAGTCDPLYRKAIRVSVGAALFVPFARAAESEDMVAAAREAGFSIVALSPRPDAVDICALAAAGALPERVALFLGSEGPGLKDATLRAADIVARIDMVAGFDSLNLATASGIALHGLRASRRL